MCKYKFQLVALLALIAVSTGSFASAETSKSGSKSGASRIKGVDSDKNGVRDDIDAHINSLSDTQPQKAALRQAVAAITNAMIINPSVKDSLVAAELKMYKATACIHERYGTTDSTKNRINDIEKLTVNTKARLKAYEKFGKAESGQTFESFTGNVCEN